jgi:hypothetical protein
MTISTAVALVLALLSTTITSLAYLREHDAAAALPVLSMRRPVKSFQLLVGDRSWLLGFAMETAGFLLYAAALAPSHRWRWSKASAPAASACSHTSPPA